jgi:hypothetical protein
MLCPHQVLLHLRGATTCASADIIYTIQAGQSNYIWSLPGTLGTDYTITSGGISSSDNTVTLKWLTSGSKAVTVNYTDANGCTGASAASSTTTVNALPTPSFSASPSASSCASTDVTYTLKPVNQIIFGPYPALWELITLLRQEVSEQLIIQ